MEGVTFMKLREFNFNSITGFMRPTNLCIKTEGATLLDKDRCFEEITIGETLKAIPIEWAEREIKETRWFFDTFVIELKGSEP